MWGTPRRPAPAAQIVPLPKLGPPNSRRWEGTPRARPTTVGSAIAMTLCRPAERHCGHEGCPGSRALDARRGGQGRPPRHPLRDPLRESRPEAAGEAPHDPRAAREYGASSPHRPRSADGDPRAARLLRRRGLVHARRRSGARLPGTLAASASGRRDAHLGEHHQVQGRPSPAARAAAEPRHQSGRSGPTRRGASICRTPARACSPACSS